MGEYVRNLDPLRGLKCPVCSYDLSGLPDHRCPECGHEFDPDQLAARVAPAVGPLAMCASYGLAMLIVLASFSNARTLTTYTGWCGTPQANAAVAQSCFVPALFLPIVIIYVMARRAHQPLLVWRVPLVISSATWLPVFLLAVRWFF
jgi:hypothetical protein